MSRFLTCLAAAVSLASSSILFAAPEPAAGLSILTNGSFEDDWYNTRSETMGCPLEPRVTFGQADSYPDGWTMTAPDKTSGQPAPIPVQRSAEAHSGHYGVTVDAKQVLMQDNVGYAIVTADAFKAVPVKATLWFKGGPVSVELVLSNPEVGEVGRKGALFDAGKGWKQGTVELSADEIRKAVVANEKARGPINIAIRITSEGPAVIDDVRVERPFAPSPYSLVANGGFDQTDTKGQPAAWSGAKKSLRHTGKTWYYIWRTWYHYMGVPRGDNAIDQLVALSGNSFRMNVPPGDEKYIESDAIPLNQTAPEKMAIRFDYNSYLLADLVVRVIDDRGDEVFFDHFAPGTTGGWHSYQKEFIPTPITPKETNAGVGVATATGESRAIKSCRVRIGVRGVNGSNQDDINQWVNVNIAGTLWFDNVALVSLERTSDQLKAAGVKVYESMQKSDPVIVEAIDLGERLYGQNTASVTIAALGKAASGSLSMKVEGLRREDDPQKAGYGNGAIGQDKMIPAPTKTTQEVTSKYDLQAGQRGTVPLPYNVENLAEDWRSEYAVTIGNGSQSSLMTFGTWSQQALVEVLRCYALPNETSQTVSLNLGVARATLEQVKSLKIEVRQARDDKAVLTQSDSDFALLLPEFNVQPLPPAPDVGVRGWEGDATNFHQVEIDISKLPVHKSTEPVRDHYVSVQGLDAGGKVLFSGTSPRFGRMEAFDEKLAPITSVAISSDNELVINGKPFLTRGHIQMQQNYGPSAMAHKPMDFKQTGFNAAGHGQSASEVPIAGTPKVDFIWNQNLYYIAHSISGKPPMTAETLAQIKTLMAHPAAVGINYIQWEAAPEAGTTDADRVAYTKAIKDAIGGRPLWISAGWYSPTVDGVVYPDYLEHDFFQPESHSYLQPSQLDKEVLAKKRLQGKPAVLGTFPNVFNDLPYDVERFEHWTDIIRGHRGGYMIIGMPGDPTLFRGMNGEMRFIESFLFSKEAAPEVKVEPAVEHLTKTANGKTYIMASNAGPVIGGDWKWQSELKDSKGTAYAAHTGDAMWNRFHPFMKDYHNHFYKDDRPTTVKKGDKVVQYVLVPKDTKIESLVLMVRVNGDWMYHAVWGEWDQTAFNTGSAIDEDVRLWLARDMHQMFWGTTNFPNFDVKTGKATINPDGRAKLTKSVFAPEQFHKIAALPAAGEWVRLEVPIETLGIVEGSVVDGFGYLSKGDRAWWGPTKLARGGAETDLCNGSAGISPDKLAKVRFNVPGLKAGTTVKVVFEERDITAGDGFFEDDLTGKPGYQNLWEGIYGDKLGETGYYGDGVFYNYNFGRVAAQLYEVPK